MVVDEADRVAVDMKSVGVDGRDDLERRKRKLGANAVVVRLKIVDWSTVKTTMARFKFDFIV